MRSIMKGEAICLTAGCLVTEANRVDFESSYLFVLHETKQADNFDEEINTWFDCAAFKDVVLYPDRVGHFANTSDPLASKLSLRLPKAEYRVTVARTANDTAESVIRLYAIANIEAGEEILVDYHWQLVSICSGAGGKRYAHDCNACNSECVYI